VRRRELLFTTGCTKEVPLDVFACRTLKDGRRFTQLLEAGAAERIRLEDFARRYLVVTSFSADASFAVIFSNRLLKSFLRFLSQLLL
jgi:hypothetical protein